VAGKAEAQAAERRGSSPHLWVTTTYFAEGFPYSVVNSIAEILFKELGASLRLIGLTALLHLPWNLKLLWAPLIDQYETKRRWLIAVEVLLTATIVGLSFVVTAREALGLIAVLFGLMAVLSATHDIAIDGFYLEGLDERGQSKFVGYRAMAYKIASVLVRGPALMLIGWVGWRYGMLATGAVMLALTVIHWALLPRVERRQRPVTRLLGWLLSFRALAVGSVIAALVVVSRRLLLDTSVWPQLRDTVAATPLGSLSAGGWIGVALLAGLLVLLAVVRRLRRAAAPQSGAAAGPRAGAGAAGSSYAAAFLDFLAQPKVGRILAFVVLFRAGESFLQKMKWPFMRDEMLLALDEYGLASGTIGVVASIVATTLGGWLITRHGLRRWIWPFVLLQNLLNLLYVTLALLPEPPGFAVVTAVITVEHFGEGLGTAVFMVYLMRCCDPAHKASHMAILTALMSVSFTLAGVASGFMAEALGFATYFGFSFLATIPGMVLIFFIPFLDGRTAELQGQGSRQRYRS